jgi:hypothetical protein
MNDDQLADEIIKRLNALIENDDVRKDVGRLLEVRVHCSEATLRHPTIQVGSYKGIDAVGLLGLLNGLVGVDPELAGSLSGAGYITAFWEGKDNLVRFQRTGSSCAPPSKET